MSFRTLGILMLLFAAILAGVNHGLSGKRHQVVAEASAAPAEQLPAPPPTAQPVRQTELPVRVILPSPYEIRTN